jgi:hypothetical protein
MDTVVVFGDSLSDIGKKWTTGSGRVARLTNQMYVSPTGRFSDCRNWTDFMFEAATGLTMVVGTAAETIDLSRRHASLTSDGLVLTYTPHSFRYANYAEGGACGDTPAGTYPAVLGTFKDQVDAFKKDCRASQIYLGHTLCIVWFGANDLYTAGREAEGMKQVAEQIADTQRERLSLIVADHNRRMLGRARRSTNACKFVFVDLCRPLASVRYAARLQQAEAAVRATLGARYAPPSVPMRGSPQRGASSRPATPWRRRRVWDSGRARTGEGPRTRWSACALGSRRSRTWNGGFTCSTRPSSRPQPNTGIGWQRLAGVSRKTPCGG